MRGWADRDDEQLERESNRSRRAASASRPRSAKQTEFSKWQTDAQIVRYDRPLFRHISKLPAGSPVFDIAGVPLSNKEGHVVFSAIRDAVAMSVHGSRLTALNLSNCGINKAMSVELGECLSQTTTLRVLNLRGNPLGADGVRNIAKGLNACVDWQIQARQVASKQRSDAAKIAMLTRRSRSESEDSTGPPTSIGNHTASAAASLTASGAVDDALAAAGTGDSLRGTLECPLLDLDLSNTQMTTPRTADGTAWLLTHGIREVSDFLMRPECRLKCLRLAKNRLTSDLCAMLLTALGHNTSLCSLDLDDCHLGTEAALAVLDVVTRPATRGQLAMEDEAFPPHQQTAFTPAHRLASRAAAGRAAIEDPLGLTANLPSLPPPKTAPGLEDGSVGAGGAGVGFDRPGAGDDRPSYSASSGSHMHGAHNTAEPASDAYGYSRAATSQAMRSEPASRRSGTAQGTSRAAADARSARRPASHLAGSRFRSGVALQDSSAPPPTNPQYLTTRNAESFPWLLYQGPSHIEVLSLRGCDLGDAGADGVRACMQRRCRLRHLGLARNRITARGARSILLAARTSLLQSVDLSNNSLGRAGAREVASALTGRLISIRKLGLAFCDLTDSGRDPTGILEIAESLKENRTLAHLDLSGNSLTLQRMGFHPTPLVHTAVYSLADALEENRTLMTLNLAKNWIGLTGQRSLRTAIQRHGGAVPFAALTKEVLQKWLEKGLWKRATERFGVYAASKHPVFAPVYRGYEGGARFDRGRGAANGMLMLQQSPLRDPRMASSENYQLGGGNGKVLMLADGTLASPAPRTAGALPSLDGRAAGTGVVVSHIGSAADPILTLPPLPGNYLPPNTPGAAPGSAAARAAVGHGALIPVAGVGRRGGHNPSSIQSSPMWPYGGGGEGKSGAMPPSPISPSGALGLSSSHLGDGISHVPIVMGLGGLDAIPESSQDAVAIDPKALLRRRRGKDDPADLDAKGRPLTPVTSSATGSGEETKAQDQPTHHTFGDSESAVRRPFMASSKPDIIQPDDRDTDGGGSEFDGNSEGGHSSSRHTMSTYGGVGPHQRDDASSYGAATVSVAEALALAAAGPSMHEHKAAVEEVIEASKRAESRREQDARDKAKQERLVDANTRSRVLPLIPQLNFARLRKQKPTKPPRSKPTAPPPSKPLPPPKPLPLASKAATGKGIAPPSGAVVLAGDATPSSPHTAHSAATTPHEPGNTSDSTRAGESVAPSSPLPQRPSNSGSSSRKGAPPPPPRHTTAAAAAAAVVAGPSSAAGSGSLPPRMPRQSASASLHTPQGVGDRAVAQLGAALSGTGAGEEDGSLSTGGGTLRTDGGVPTRNTMPHTVGTRQHYSSGGQDGSGDAAASRSATGADSGVGIDNDSMRSHQGADGNDDGWFFEQGSQTQPTTEPHRHRSPVVQEDEDAEHIPNASVNAAAFGPPNTDDSSAPVSKTERARRASALLAPAHAEGVYASSTGRSAESMAGRAATEGQSRPKPSSPPRRAPPVAASDTARSDWSAGGGWADSNRAFDLDEVAQADADAAAAARKGFERALREGTVKSGQRAASASVSASVRSASAAGLPSLGLVLPHDIAGQTLPRPTSGHQQPLPPGSLVSPGVVPSVSSSGTLQIDSSGLVAESAGAGNLFPSITPGSAQAALVPFRAGGEGVSPGSGGIASAHGKRRATSSRQDWRVSALRAATAQAEARDGLGSPVHAEAAGREALAAVRAQTAGMAPYQGQMVLGDGLSYGHDSFVSKPLGSMVASSAGKYGYPQTPHAVDHEALAIADRERAAEMEAIARVDALRVSVVREQWDKIAPGYSVASQMWLVSNVVDLVFSFLEEPREVFFDDDRMRELNENSFATAKTSEQVQAAAAGGPGVDRGLSNADGKLNLGKTKSALNQIEASLHGGHHIKFRKSK